MHLLGLIRSEYGSNASDHLWNASTNTFEGSHGSVCPQCQLHDVNTSSEQSFCYGDGLLFIVYDQYSNDSLGDDFLKDGGITHEVERIQSIGELGQEIFLIEDRNPQFLSLGHLAASLLAC